MTVMVEVEHTGHGTIHVVSFDRPQARNAMDTELLAATIDALDAVERQDDARGVLITGSGGAFSAGADVHEAMEDGGRRRMELFTALYEQLTLFRLPTAAAIEGPAVGGGAEVAAACDLRVAAAGATFRFPGAAFGIPIGMARTIGQVGLSTAKDWVLSTRTVPAVEAYERGFVQRLVPDGATVDVARAWLVEVAAQDPETVGLLKRLFNDHAGVRDRVAFENDALRVQAESGRLPAMDGDLPRTVRPRRR